MPFSTIRQNIDDLNQNMQAYVNAKFKYFELKALKKITEITAGVIKGTLIAFFFLFFLIMLSIAVGVLIGQKLDDLSLGFFIVAGFYLLLLIFILIFGKRIFSSTIVKILSKKMVGMHKSKDSQELKK